jgi:hypothetical protein
MKNLLTIAIVLCTVNAFATRSRDASLGGSIHLEDFYSPENLFTTGDILRIESGITNVTTVTGVNSGSEGTLRKSVGEGKIGLSLGHAESTIFANRAASGVATIVPQQNELNLSYGFKLADLTLGAGLLYSNYENKISTEKESSSGVKLGVMNSAFYTNATIVTGDSYEKGASIYKGTTGFNLTGGYNLTNSMSVHANIVSSGYKVNDGALKDVSSTNVAVKFVETIQKDGNDFFYGAGLSTTSLAEKKADTKDTTMNLPVIIGLEANASSWLKLRASVAQDVLISDSKTTAPAGTTAEKSPGKNTTAFAAGAGLTFNKVVIDGSIMTGVANAGSQNINSGDLLANVGLTYNF